MGWSPKAHVILVRGHYRQARQDLESVVASQRTQMATDNPALAGTLINLGLVLIEIPDLDAAEKTFTESLRIWQNKYGREFEGAQVALGGLGHVHLLEDQLDRAESELREVVKAGEKRPANDNYTNVYLLGELERLRKHPADAVILDRQALKLARQARGENNEYTAMAHHYLGLALRDSGDTANAEAELRAALASFAGYIPNAEHPLAATTRVDLAMLLSARADPPAEIRRLLSEAVAVREQFLGADDPLTRQARQLLVKVAH